MSNLHISSDFSGLDALIPQGRRVFVVIDSNLKPFFGLFERYELIPIQTSEKVKTFATVEYIIEQLLERGADRSSFLVGVGGGITTTSAVSRRRFTTGYSVRFRTYDAAGAGGRFDRG